MKRSLYLLVLRFHQRRRHLQENARSRRSREQTTRVRKDMVEKMQHDMIMSIAVKRKCGIRNLCEARRGSATVQGHAECKKRHTAHVQGQHGEWCGWQVGECH
jgi:hypothetical protein